MTRFKFPLMSNNISNDDISQVKKFLKNYGNKNIILTSNKNVKLFEKKWSKWLGCKYSVLVNSGSSSNFMSIAYLKTKFAKGEIIVPTLTWPSDVMAIINNGFKPVFVDINLNNLSANEDQILKSINKNTIALFLTHAQGFSGLTDTILKTCKKKKIILIEDVCESHGAKHKNKKLGTFGLISCFSFYYAHHLSTIEGGMVCTNNLDAYRFLQRMRGHGMLRENDKFYENKIVKKFPKLNPKFIFIEAGFNFRNNEIGAIIGINQLKKLNNFIKLRNKNFLYFLKNINKNIYFTNFDKKGISNYAFPIILNNRSLKIRDKFEKYLTTKNIEFRRGNAGGGNQLMQPYLKNYKPKSFKNFKNVNLVHNYGYYIGNYPSLETKRLKELLKILNNFKL